MLSAKKQNIMINKYLTFGFVAFFVLLGLGCEEVPPVLNPGGGGGPITGNQQRQVLIEEFTGERCVNCPAGSEVIESLLGVHGDRLIAVSIHAGFFAVAYPESDDELANETGSAILNLLDAPLGYPTAVVNRRHFPGEENRQVGQATWPGYIASELEAGPQVRIGLSSTYNDASGELDIDAVLDVVEDLEYEDVRLTVYITENNITDPQQTPEGVDYEYKHKHVLRAAVSAVDGDALNENFTAGASINRSFSITLDPAWVPEECHIVAFVHQGGGTLDVIQAHEISVIE